MIKTIVIKQIEVDGTAFVIGDRVRVLLKNKSEYIGTITKILSESFILLVDDEKKAFQSDTVAKMRAAGDNESFYNTWNFDADKKNFRVVATRKGNSAESMNILISITEEQAEKYCEQWGWSYSEGEKSYWLSIEPMN